MGFVKQVSTSVSRLPYDWEYTTTTQRLCLRFCCCTKFAGIGKYVRFDNPKRGRTLIEKMIDQWQDDCFWRPIRRAHRIKIVSRGEMIAEKRIYIDACTMRVLTPFLPDWWPGRRPISIVSPRCKATALKLPSVRIST